MGWQDINDFSAVSDRFDLEVAMMKRVFPQVELCEVLVLHQKCLYHGEHHDRPIQSLGFWGSLCILLMEELMLGEWQSDLWKIQLDLGPGLK